MTRGTDEMASRQSSVLALECAVTTMRCGNVSEMSTLLMAPDSWTLTGNPVCRHTRAMADGSGLGIRLGTCSMRVARKRLDEISADDISSIVVRPVTRALCGRP